VGDLEGSRLSSLHVFGRSFLPLAGRAGTPGVGVSEERNGMCRLSTRSRSIRKISTI